MDHGHDPALDHHQHSPSLQSDFPCSHTSPTWGHNTIDPSMVLAPSDLVLGEPAVAGYAGRLEYQTTHTATNSPAESVHSADSLSPASGQALTQAGQEYHVVEQLDIPNYGTVPVGKTIDNIFICLWPGCNHRGGYKRRGCIRRHIRCQHIDPGSYKCEWCEKVFNRVDNRALHYERIHNQTK
ncbi:hypothetical protein BJY00DRAFT_64255 [Aspergillus carlsbadensis]|nr:hypothetical protein BJY00DRAFT_64255 [Aspergillus carlsbadensis]